MVECLQENAEQLQSADVQQMPEQMVKIAEPLYKTLMPMVIEQVAAQIKVCDMSKTNVSVSPSEFGSWEAVAQQLVKERSAPVLQKRDRSIAAVKGSMEDVEMVKAEYAAKLADIEADVYHSPNELHMEVSSCYNFL